MQLHRHKNHVDVVKAFASCNFTDEEKVYLVFTGSGYNKNNSVYHELIREVVELNLESNIKILGELSQQQVYLLIKKARAVVSASSYEGWNTVIEEAQCLRAQNILVTDIPVHYEQLEKSVASFYKQGDIAELAHIMAKALINEKVPNYNYKHRKEKGDLELQQFIVSHVQ
jgi:glycosyltransferase involved in cell wall biosynthesis